MGVSAAVFKLGRPMFAAGFPRPGESACRGTFPRRAANACQRSCTKVSVEVSAEASILAWATTLCLS